MEIFSIGFYDTKGVYFNLLSDDTLCMAGTPRRYVIRVARKDKPYKEQTISKGLAHFLLNLAESSK